MENTQTTPSAYYADQIEGRPESNDLARMWDVVETSTGRVVASWRDTPLTGMTEKEAIELAAAWSSQK